MLVGIIILILTNGNIKAKMLRNANRTEKISENASLLELGMGNWVKRAIDVSAMVLMVTAMGAAFASVLSSQPVVSEIAEVVAKSGIPMILIPFIIAAVMRAAAGSMGNRIHGSSRYLPADHEHAGPVSGCCYPGNRSWHRTVWPCQ